MSEHLKFINNHLTKWQYITYMNRSIEFRMLHFNFGKVQVPRNILKRTMNIAVMHVHVSALQQFRMLLTPCKLHYKYTNHANTELYKTSTVKRGQMIHKRLPNS